MRILYINDELTTGDGSNSHAVGMLQSFQEILGQENVRSFPEPEDGSQKQVNLKAGKLKSKLKNILAFVRFFRKKYLSVKRSQEIFRKLRTEGFVPTHIIARSTNFDVTAIQVAKKFNAKLIYEINTPMYYECGVIKKESMIRQIEKWEERIIKASDYVYVVSNICRDMLCEHYQLSKDKFIVIPNGYMKELYHENDVEREIVRNSVRAEEGLEDKFVVTFVGSLKVWHGIKAFCETAALMEQNKDVHFLVLGDGEMHEMIMNYVSSHKNMIFKGKVSLEVMKQYLYASDLGIMPYEKKDNFYYSPLKMFDMIGAGLPFIGTSVGQIEEFCNEFYSGKNLVANGEIGELVNCIQMFFESSDELENHKIQVQKQQKNCTWTIRAQQLLEGIIE